MSLERAFIEKRAKLEHAHSLTPLAKPEPLLPAEIHKRGNPYANTRTGLREDLGVVLRSGWEANIARVFLVSGIEWEFEPTHFPFPIKKGVKGYVPDFYLSATDEWVEVKGYLDNHGRTKLKRFKKYYPSEFSRFVVITGPSRDAMNFFQDLGVPTILTYAGFRSEYKATMANWEGL